MLYVVAFEEGRCSLNSVTDDQTVTLVMSPYDIQKTLVPRR
jgi:hypothetical protein